MKKIQKIAALLLVVGIVFSGYGIRANAAAGSSSLSGGSGNVGATVTVSGTVSSSKVAMGAATVTLSYDPASLQYIGGSSGTNGGSGSAIYSGYGDGSVKSISFTMNFKILKEGSHKISGTVDAYNMDESQLNVGSVSATVTGKVVEEKSTNTNLKALKVYPGTLSPSFSEGTRSYTLNVPKNTTSVTISAETKSSKASFYVTGNTNLKEGTNYAAVVVTAESGKTGKYNIAIVVPKDETKQDEPKEDEPKKDEPKEDEPKEDEPVKAAISVQIDGATYTVQEDFAKKEIPEGFEENSVTLKEQEVLGVYNRQCELQLLYLKSEDGKASFFIHLEEDAFYPFRSIKISEKKAIIPVPLTTEDEQPKNASKKSLVLGGQNFDAWNSEDKEYYIFPAFTNDGTRRLYSYDVEDGTFQRYHTTEVEAETTEETVTEKEDADLIDTILPDEIKPYYDYILLGCAGVIVILLVLVLAFGINADKRRRKKLKWLRSRREQEDEF